MYATLGGYEVNWKTGPEQMLLVSVGTGASDPSRAPSQIAAEGAIKALLGLMDDCAALVETVMQWMSSSSTARVIDREIGDLSGDQMAGSPVLSYLRYDVALTDDGVRALGVGLSSKQMESLGEMDNPDNLDVLLKLGEAAGERRVQPADFAAAFDLGK
jgi:hypothetical protein